MNLIINSNFQNNILIDSFNIFEYKKENLNESLHIKGKIIYKDFMSFDIKWKRIFEVSQKIIACNEAFTQYIF